MKSKRYALKSKRYPLFLVYLIPSVLFLLCASAAPSAASGAAFGFRVGYADVTGSVFPGSGDLDGVKFFGLQAAFPLMPTAAVVIAGEARNDKLSFNRAGAENVFVHGSGKWSDLSLHGSLRLRLIPLGLASLYGGAGGGVHFSKVNIDDGSVAVVPGSGAAALQSRAALARGAAPNRVLSLQQDPIHDFIDRAEKEQTDLSWHILGGLNFPLPVIPLSLFAEARYEEITGDFKHTGYLAYAGVNLELP
jgi:hypothetical protein